MLKKNIFFVLTLLCFKAQLNGAQASQAAATASAKPKFVYQVTFEGKKYNVGAFLHKSQDKTVLHLIDTIAPILVCTAATEVSSYNARGEYLLAPGVANHFTFLQTTNPNGIGKLGLKIYDHDVTDPEYTFHFVKELEYECEHNHGLKTFSIKPGANAVAGAPAGAAAKK